MKSIDDYGSFVSDDSVKDDSEIKNQVEVKANQPNQIIMGPLNKFNTEGHNGYPSELIIPDGLFLNNSIPFNYRLTTGLLNEYSEQLYSRISTHNNFYNSQDKIQAINSIISNILTAFFNHKCIAYSRNKGRYNLPDMYGMYHYTHSNIIPAVDWMIQNYYLEQACGFYDSIKGSGRNSRIWATKKLIEEAEEFIFSSTKSISNWGLIRQLKYNWSIVLKNEKEIIPCPITEETIRMKKFLTEYNEFINFQQIILPLDLIERNKHSSFSSSVNAYFSYNESIYIPDSFYNIHIPTNIIIQAINNSSISQSTTTNHIYNIPHSSLSPLLSQFDVKRFTYNDLKCQLYRVFNVNLKQGGRFYGGEYQGLPEEVRKNLIIGGENVVELDYSSLHLTMLYHRLGIDYKDEPYLAINNNDELRPLYKLISLIIINSGSKADAVRGFNTTVYKDLIKKHNRKFHKENLTKYDLSFGKLYNQFIDTHKDLEPYFLSGEGIRLQKKDSEIAERIMKYFLRLNIPCLSVHDSFIVPEKYKDELKEVMQRAYKIVMQTNYEVKIK